MYIVCSSADVNFYLQYFPEYMIHISEPIPSGRKDIYHDFEYLDFEKDFEPISREKQKMKSQVFCRKPYNNPIQGRNY